MEGQSVIAELIDGLIDKIAEVNNNPTEKTFTNGLSKDNNNLDNKIGELLQNEKFHKIPCQIINQELSFDTEFMINQNDQSELQQNQAICKKPKIEDSILNKQTLDKPKAELSMIISNDLETDETKQMAVLRNVVISPPPPLPQQPSSIQQTQLPVNDEEKKPTNSNDAKETSEQKQSTKGTETKDIKRKSTNSSISDLDQSGNEESGSSRIKRQRTQTKLFQAGDLKPASAEPFESSSNSPSPIKANRQPRTANKGRKKSTTSPNCSEANLSHYAQDNVQECQNIKTTNDLQDVIFYEKNDYLAIRNEENTFYLCQLTENVRSVRPMIRVKWLDTNDDGKTYFLTAHYDKVPHKSIIMPVLLNKLKSEKKGEQMFTLDDQDRENIMDRLRRSVIASQNHLNSSQDSSITE